MDDRTAAGGPEPEVEGVRDAMEALAGRRLRKARETVEEAVRLAYEELGREDGPAWAVLGL